MRQLVQKVLPTVGHSASTTPLAGLTRAGNNQSMESCSTQALQHPWEEVPSGVVDS